MDSCCSVAGRPHVFAFHAKPLVTSCLRFVDPNLFGGWGFLGSWRQTTNLLLCDETTMATLFVRLLTVILVLFQGIAYGFSPLENSAVKRRDLLRSLAEVAGASSFLVLPANAVVSTKSCISGVGDGCDDLSEGNELIKSLQTKSAMNREKNMNVS